jgi:hypothetical protein
MLENSTWALCYHWVYNVLPFLVLPVIAIWPFSCLLQLDRFGIWPACWIWSCRLPLRAACCLMSCLAVLIICMVFKEINADLRMWWSFVFRVLSLLVSKLLFIGELCNHFSRFSICKVIDPVFSVNKRKSLCWSDFSFPQSITNY